MIRTGITLALLLGLAWTAPLQAQWQFVASDAVVEMDGLPVLPGEVRAEADDAVVLMPVTELVSTGDTQDTGIAGVAADRLSGQHVFIGVTTPTGNGSLPGDVLRCAVDGSGCTTVFSAAAAGVPEGVGVSAVGVEVVAGAQQLLLSFDTSFELAGQVYRPGDVLRYDGENLAMALSHADLGTPPFLDVSGLARRPDSSWQLGFAHGSALGGAPFFSSDVLQFDPAGAPAGFEARLRSVDVSWQQAGIAGWDALATGRAGFPGLGSTINPGDASVVLEVSRTGGVESRIAVEYATVDGTATAGVDYQAVSGTLVWEHGESGSRQIVVDLVNAGTAADRRQFSLQLSPASPWALTTGRDALALELPDSDSLFSDSFEN